MPIRIPLSRRHFETDLHIVGHPPGSWDPKEELMGYTYACIQTNTQNCLLGQTVC